MHQEQLGNQSFEYVNADSNESNTMLCDNAMNCSDCCSDNGENIGDHSDLEIQSSNDALLTGPSNSPKIRSSETTPKQFAYPIVTLCLITIIWCIYLIGVGQSSGLSSIRLSSPVAPDNERWWFVTVSFYPQCEDKRLEFYRIFASQFVHVGLTHIGGNTLCILLYGIVVECFLPWGHITTLIIFEWAIINGALGFSLVFPYIGLVGASPGLYGLIGACWTIAIMYRDLLPEFLAFCLPGTLIVQLIMDIVVYTIFYNGDTAYVAHFFGMISGFALSAMISMIYKSSQKLWLRMLYSTLGGILLVFVFGGLLFHYRKEFPPQPYVKNYLNNYDQREACCANLFYYKAIHPDMTNSEIISSYPCNDD